MRRLQCLTLSVVTMLWCAAATLAVAQDRAAKPSGLVEIKAGTLPVVLSAPHGGTKPIPGVPERQNSDRPRFVTTRDLRTIELAEAIADELEKLTGGRPYIVFMHAERKYLDANRRPGPDAWDSDGGKMVYEEYHAALEKFCREVREKWEHGLLLDVHGQGTELDAVFRGTRNGRTVKQLADRKGPEVTREINRIFEKHGLKMLPPPAGNDNRETQFTGGEIVIAHSSEHPHGLDAVQLEFGTNLRRRERIGLTASDTAKAIAELLEWYPNAN